MAIAEKNKKVSSWLRNETRIRKQEKEESNTRGMEREMEHEMEWTDPVIEQERSERKREAGKRQEHFWCRGMVKSIVEEMIKQTPATSVVGRLMDKVISEAALMGQTASIWKELESDEILLKMIEEKIEDRKHTKRLEMEEEGRRERLKIREWKRKKWLEKRRMEKLVEEMSYLELGSFEGEWEEHEKLDDWMMKAQEYGVLIDEDELMGDVNARDSENDMKDSGRNIYIDIDDEEKMEYVEVSTEKGESYEV